MAKLVTKFKYLKPGKKKKGGYARYIATREGVEKIDDSQIHAPATEKQQQLIQKIIADNPEVMAMLEYEDYNAKPTVGNASELISRALEDVADSILNEKTYADYIATRPRAQRFGAHGLFTDEGKPVNLRGAICSALTPMNSLNSSTSQCKTYDGLPLFITRATILMSM